MRGVGQIATVALQRGFQRIELDPGERKTVVFELGPEALAFTGRDLKPTIEAGTFQIWVGSDSTAELTTDFELTE